MAHHGSKIPEPGTYGRVLRRYDRDPRHAHQQRFVSYDVTLRAVAARMGNTVAMTLFFPVGRDAAADRACRQGWIDCTDEWHATLGAAPEPDMEPIAQALDALEWNDLRKRALGAGVDASGKRREVTARLLAYERQRLVDQMLAAVA